MSPEPGPSPLDDALAARARAEPEQPFLFFRDERGHFRWWSFERAAAALAGDGPALTAGGGNEAGAWLDAARVAASERCAASLEASLGSPPGGRDVWIARRPAADPLEAALLLWSARRGAAVLREPIDRLRPELVVWARPTLIQGAPAELVELASGLARLAPRFGARRWLNRRLSRLRAVLVDSTEVGEVALALAAWELAEAPRVLPFPSAGW